MEEVMRVLFDTMIYSALATDEPARQLVASAVAARRIEVIATPMVRDQLARGPHGGIPPWFPVTLLPESVFVLDRARLDEALLGSGEAQRLHLGASRSRGNLQDSIIADSGVAHADIIVTNERRFLRRLAYDVRTPKGMNFNNFRAWLGTHAA